MSEFCRNHKGVARKICMETGVCPFDGSISEELEYVDESDVVDDRLTGELTTDLGVLSIEKTRIKRHEDKTKLPASGKTPRSFNGTRWRNKHPTAD